MRVLVTGGAGFVGSHVVEQLQAGGHEPWIFDRVAPAANGEAGARSIVGDVRDEAALLQAALGCGAIIHLAAVADVNVAVLNPDETQDTNVTGTRFVLRAAANAGIGTVLYASTVWVYGDVNGSRVDENNPLPEPREVYTASKLAGERVCAEEGDALGIAPTVLRLGIPYGPRARPAGVVARFVAAALSGQPLSIAGDGRQTRPFVYVSDVADGILAALAPQAAGRTYNLCPDNVSISIGELAEVIRTEVAAVPIAYAEARQSDIQGGPISAARAREELGWVAQTTLSDGVRRYVDWVTETEGKPVAAQAESIDGSAATI
jgi:UDP-glucose 4-epimerase